MPLNVLITAGSRRTALVAAFRRALADTVAGRVIVTDVNEMSPAVHLADAAFRVPMSTEPGYVETIEAICREQNVGLVVPTIDDELELFGAARHRFELRGIRVAVSSRETAAVCNDKLRTSATLQRHGIAAASSWLPQDVPASAGFPLFVKPRFGRGSVGAFPARDANELKFFGSYVEQAVVQEYLDGPEFTIDLLCNEGEPLAVVARERVVIRAGVMDRGRTVRDTALIDLGVACARALGFHGPVNIQCRVVGGVPTVFEINPRFSGGIPLTIAAGADIPRMLVDLALGRRVKPSIGRYADGLWMTCYETGLFIADERRDVFQARPVAAKEVA